MKVLKDRLVLDRGSRRAIVTDIDDAEGDLKSCRGVVWCGRRLDERWRGSEFSPCAFHGTPDHVHAPNLFPYLFNASTYSKPVLRSFTHCQLSSLFGQGSKGRKIQAGPASVTIVGNLQIPDPDPTSSYYDQDCD